MVNIILGSSHFARCLAVLAIFACGFVSAYAQDKKPEATTAATAEKSRPKSDWVKICDKMQVKKKGKDEKDAVQDLEYCLTQQEALSANGSILYAIGLREIKGNPQKVLMITVAYPGPIGIAAAPGMGVTIDGHKDVHRLTYAHCNPSSCTAETQIKDATIAQMKAAKSFKFTAFAANGQPFGKSISLKGFTATLEGQPLDVKTYTAAKRKMLDGIAKRQKEAIESDPKMKQAVEALAEARKNLVGVVEEKKKAVQGTPSEGGRAVKPDPKKK